MLAGTRFEPGGNLANADMRDADLSHAEMGGLDLTQVTLIGARVVGATLEGARMQGALLSDADLARSDLYDVDLRGAALYRADLNGANLRGAMMYNAKLGLLPIASIRNLERDEDAGADLSTARNLTQEQLDAAHGDETTKIPAGLTRPAHWSMSPAAPRRPQEQPQEHDQDQGAGDLDVEDGGLGHQVGEGLQPRRERGGRGLGDGDGTGIDHAREHDD